MSKLSERIKEYMAEREINQTVLANATGVKPANVSQILSGLYTPQYSYFIALLYYFNCSADYLLGLTDIHTEQPLHSVPKFSERLFYILQEHNISRYRLSIDLKISSSVIHKWIHGVSEPSTDTLILLSRYFDCSVDYLIGRIR